MRQCLVGAYESLAGFSVSRSPDGVGVGHLPVSVHRMSPLFPTGITPRGDRYQSNPRPQVLHFGIYMLIRVFISYRLLPDGQGKQTTSPDLF